MILILGLLLIAIQIVLLVFSIKKKKSVLWIMLFASECLSALIAKLFMDYFDSLPGYGFMPGLSYFGEYLICYGTLILSVVMLVLSIIIGTVILFKRNNNKKS